MVLYNFKGGLNVTPLIGIAASSFDKSLFITNVNNNLVGTGYLITDASYNGKAILFNFTIDDSVSPLSVDPYDFRSDFSSAKVVPLLALAFIVAAISSVLVALFGWFFPSYFTTRSEEEDHRFAQWYLQDRSLSELDLRAQLTSRGITGAQQDAIIADYLAKRDAIAADLGNPNNSPPEGTDAFWTTWYGKTLRALLQVGLSIIGVILLVLGGVALASYGYRKVKEKRSKKS